MHEVGRAIRRAAPLAGVAVLVGGTALRAAAAHEAVGEKHARQRIEELLDGPRHDEAPVAERLPDLTAEPAVGIAVGGAVVIELDLKAREVGEVGLAHRGDQFLLAAALGLRPDHDRRAVGVVGTEIDRPVPSQLLKPHEDVGLDVLDQVPEVNVAVGVRQGRGDENSAGAGCGHDAPGGSKVGGL